LTANVLVGIFQPMQSRAVCAAQIRQLLLR